MRGHSVLDAMPSSRSSSAIANAHNDIPNFAIMYAVGFSHSGSSRIGGDSVRMCGFSRPIMCGMQACDTAYVPRTWMPFIRSKRLSGTSLIEPRLIAEALFTQMSMPPNCSTVWATADATDSPSRMSPTIGSACPPASSISLAAVYTVPGELGVGFGGLGDQRDVGAVGGGALGDRQPDAAAGAGDEHGLPGERHGPPYGRVESGDGARSDLWHANPRLAYWNLISAGFRTRGYRR